MESRISFGVFQADLRSGELHKNGLKIRIQEKPFRLLELLLQQPGELVTRDELREKLWPADTFVDFDHSLGTAVGKLRQALGDSAQNPRFIETLPGRGYRFISPVRIGAEADPRQAAALGLQPTPPDPQGFRLEPPAANAEPGSSPVPAQRFAYSVRRLRLHWLAFALALSGGLAVVVGSYVATRGFPPATPQPRAKLMLAVLPFENLTGDSTQEFVSDGFTEEMITDLGSLDPAQLGVIARTSAMAYKGTVKPAERIGRELGVDYVLEGSVRRWADGIRISAQLIRTSDQTHVWARNYSSERPDILKLQSEVAQDVARHISLTLSPHAQPAGTVPPAVDPQVYELCLLGRYHWNKRTDEGLRKALDYFQRAIDRAPNYAPGYAGLADAYAVLPYYSAVPESASFPRAKLAAERALRLDERLPEAHATLGLVHTYYSDWPKAEEEFQRALTLNPNYATAHHWYAFFLWHTGRHEEALAHVERARQLDPLSVIINADEGKLLYDARQNQRAVAQLQKAIELDAQFAEAHRTLALAYARTGRLSEAMAQARQAAALDPGGPQSVAVLGYVSALAGRAADAQKALVELQPLVQHAAASPYLLAYIYTGLKDNDQAIRCLEQAYAAGPSGRTEDIDSEPLFDTLRPDARFRSLRDRVHQRNMAALQGK